MLKKRISAAAAAALLLAGCAGHSAVQDAPAQTPAPEDVHSAPAAQASAAGDLRAVTMGDNAGYYMAELLDGDLVRYSCADYAAGNVHILCDVPDCSHDSTSCPAIGQAGQDDALFVLDDDTLISVSNFQFPRGGEPQVILRDRGGGSRRVLATLEGYDAVFSGDVLGYTDGETFYCTAIQGEQNALLGISLADGSIRGLGLWDNMGILGCSGRTLILRSSDITYYAADGDPADTTAAGSTRLYLYRLDTGEFIEWKEYFPVQGTKHHPNQSCAVLDGTLYVYDYSANALTACDPQTGAEVVLADTLPGDPNEGRGYYTCTPSAVLDGWVLLDTTSTDWENTDADPICTQWLVNTRTGEMREKPALPEFTSNGQARQPILMSQSGSRLLVIDRTEPVNLTTIGTDGAPYTYTSEVFYLALISVSDYLGGNANYTELGEWVV